MSWGSRTSCNLDLGENTFDSLINKVEYSSEASSLCNLHGKRFEILTQKVIDSKTIHSLYLTDTKLEKTDLIHLNKMLLQSSTLLRLEIQGIEYLNSKLFCEGLKKNKTLVHLDLKFKSCDNSLYSDLEECLLYNFTLKFLRLNGNYTYEKLIKKNQENLNKFKSFYSYDSNIKDVHFFEPPKIDLKKKLVQKSHYSDHIITSHNGICSMNQLIEVIDKKQFKSTKEVKNCLQLIISLINGNVVYFMLKNLIKI